MGKVKEPLVIQVGALRSSLPSTTPTWATTLLDDALSYEVPNSYFMKNNSNNDWVRNAWDGKVHLFNVKTNTFLTGFVPRIKKLLEDHFETVYLNYGGAQSTTLPDNTEYHLSDSLEIREYQTEAVNAMISNKRGIVWASPRAGKTIMEIMFHSRAGIIPHINVCERLDIAYQTKEKFEKFIPGLQVGLVADGHVDIRDVTICTIQSLMSAFNKRYKEKTKESRTEREIETIREKEQVRNLVRTAKVVFCDESHHLASDSYRFIFERIDNAEYIIGLSGTPWREDNKDLLLEGLAGPVIYEVTYSKLVDLGYLIPPTIYFVRLPKLVDDAAKSYPQIYSEGVVENEFRNKVIKRAAEQLLEKGKSVLIIVRQLKHGRILNEMIKNSVFLKGADDSQYRKVVFDMVREGEVFCLISTLADEGLDLPILSATIIAAGGDSGIKAFQRLRCLTPHESKTEALVVDFYDPYKHLQKHSRKRLNLYKDEPSFTVIEKKAEIEKYELVSVGPC